MLCYSPQIYDKNRLPINMLYQQMSKSQCKKCIKADGGDELFAGYTSINKNFCITRIFSKKIPQILNKINTSNVRYILGLLGKNNIKRKLSRIEHISSYKNIISILDNLQSYFTEMTKSVKLGVSNIDNYVSEDQNVNYTNDDISNMDGR